MDFLIQKKINYECKTIYLPTMKFLLENLVKSLYIFPFMINDEVYNECINMDAVTGSAFAKGT